MALGALRTAAGRGRWLRDVLRTYRVDPVGRAQGRVLVSYVTEAFGSGGEPSAAHMHNWETTEMARAFAARGLRVDVISYLNRWWRPRGSYEVVVDARRNLERLDGALGPGCVKVLHADTAHLLYQNAAEAARLLAVQQRRGVTLQPRRWERPNRGIEHADCATLLGNAWTESTWAYAGKPVHRLPAPTPTSYEWPAQRDPERARRRFVWLGSPGMVHKGLDLALEAFAAMPDLELHVCGPVDGEPDFAAAYERELRHAPNVTVHGWVDVAAAQFAELLAGCAGFVYPTCSEGQAGSLTTALHGALVPAVTEQCGVDVDGFGERIVTPDVEGVQRAVRAIADAPPAEVAERARTAWETARATYTRARYAERYGAFVDALLDGRATAATPAG